MKRTLVFPLSILFLLAFSVPVESVYAADSTHGDSTSTDDNSTPGPSPTPAKAKTERPEAPAAAEKSVETQAKEKLSDLIEEEDLNVEDLLGGLDDKNPVDQQLSEAIGSDSDVGLEALVGTSGAAKIREAQARALIEEGGPNFASAFEAIQKKYQSGEGQLSSKERAILSQAEKLLSDNPELAALSGSWAAQIGDSPLSMAVQLNRWGQDLSKGDAKTQTELANTIAPFIAAMTHAQRKAMAEQLPSTGNFAQLRGAFATSLSTNDESRNRLLQSISPFSSSFQQAWKNEQTKTEKFNLALKSFIDNPTVEGKRGLEEMGLTAEWAQAVGRSDALWAAGLKPGEKKTDSWTWANSPRPSLSSLKSFEEVPAPFTITAKSQQELSTFIPRGSPLRSSDSGLYTLVTQTLQSTETTPQIGQVFTATRIASLQRQRARETADSKTPIPTITIDEDPPELPPTVQNSDTETPTEDRPAVDAPLFIDSLPPELPSSLRRADLEQPKTDETNQEPTIIEGLPPAFPPISPRSDNNNPRVSRPKIDPHAGHDHSGHNHSHDHSGHQH